MFYNRKLYFKEVTEMFKKLKDKLENWENKDTAIDLAKEAYKGYAAVASLTLFTMFVMAKVTGKQFDLVDKK